VRGAHDGTHELADADADQRAEVSVHQGRCARDSRKTERRDGRGARQGYRLRFAREERLPLCPRNVGVWSLVSSPGRHRGLREWAAFAVYGTEEPRRGSGGCLQQELSRLSRYHSANVLPQRLYYVQQRTGGACGNHRLEVGVLPRMETTEGGRCRQHRTAHDAQRYLPEGELPGPVGKLYPLRP